MAVSGAVGAIYKAAGTATAFSQKPMTNVGDNKRYFVTDRAVCYWDDETPVTVEKSTNGGTNWTTVTTGFEIEHAGGFVAFSADQGTAIFRVSGKYFTPIQIGGGFSWTLDIEREMHDATTFESGGWREFVSGLGGFTGSFEKYWSNGEIFSELGNEQLILVLYVDAGPSKNRYEGYGILNTDSIETPVDDLVSEAIDFQGSGKIYYRAG
ncbi:hypothetical protein [Paenibacillus sp. EPM92]|uniref:hypothetical protein n=1 Tax=Paenibacillus sp. EPM92 TaxID=1561195 RepID=UPI0019155F80|nr:hypothetical protein [Paenibacillus sp. EPM92]